MINNLHTFLRSRRSIRRFKSDPVPNETIQRILETTICAPSAHNLQPWRFAVVTGEKTKLHLTEALANKFRQDMIADGIPEADIQASVEKTVRRAGETPVMIVLCRDRISVRPQPDAVRKQTEALMSTQSVALAGLQLLLAAHAEGLGGTWICWPLFAPEETRHALGLDPNWEPEGMIFLGFPAETPEEQEKRPLKEITFYI
jgi:coenzyme F420-0:L-glutamate ligase/coenzyme F420-1:gamma-L-glutamate ligase